MEDQGRNSSLRILIVDDEKDLVDLLSYNLEKEGYAVLRAYDGEEALKILRSRKPDLILLDLMLPGIQGMEICKIVRKTRDEFFVRFRNWLISGGIVILTAWGRMMYCMART